MTANKSKVGVRVLRRPSGSGTATEGVAFDRDDEEEHTDGGGPLFTIFNTLLDYPQALEAVRAELQRKRQNVKEFHK